MQPDAAFSTLGTGYMFSLACYRLHVSSACYWLHVYPRLLSVTVTHFPSLGIGYLFSRAWHRLLAFPRLASLTCFPALGIGYLLSRAWRRFLVFPPFAPVTLFLPPFVVAPELSVIGSPIILVLVLRKATKRHFI